MRSLVWNLLAAASLWSCALHVCAQEAPQPLGQGRDALEMPGVGRVLLVFLLVSALAVGIAFVLRRVLPKLGGPLRNTGSLRVIDRVTVNPGLRMHVIDVEGERILLAESRNGVALMALRGAMREPPRDQTS